MPQHASTKTGRTRDALIHAALDRFLSHGVQATSVAHIAADAGVTERTFYRYFASKEHVLFSDFDARLDWFRTALRVRPPRESIVVSVRNAVESFPDDAALLEIARLRGAQMAADQISSHMYRVQANFAHEIEIHLRGHTTDTSAEAVLRAKIQAQMIGAAMFTALDVWLGMGTADVDELARLIDASLDTVREGVS